MITVKNINKFYDDFQVLKNVNMSVNKSEIVSIIGASGAGKTTLLQIIGTLDKADSGEVWINNRQINILSEKNLSSFRNNEIGFVFQFHHLLSEFTALENVCIPAFIAGETKKKSEKKAIELLEMLNLKDRMGHKPSELSGGEQQRIAVARALINNPSIILADEPSGNLDSNNAKELHKLFFDLRDRYNQTFVIVTHNEELADMSDRKIIMKDGYIIN